MPFLVIWGEGLMATGTYELITTEVLSSPAASISLTGIDQSYRDLRLVTFSDTSTQAYFRVRINGDSASNYHGIRLYGNGVSAYSDSFANQNLIYGYDTLSTTVVTFDFFDYSTTDRKKPILASQRAIANGVFEWCWRWNNTSAITQIDVFEYSTGNLPATFGFHLFGIAS